MKIDSKVRHSWIFRLADVIEPTFFELGFRRPARDKFVRQTKDRKESYGLVLRHPSHGDTCHECYVNPWVAVRLGDVQAVEALLRRRPEVVRSGTVGGSLGLFKPCNSYEEWPVDDEQSALALAPRLIHDIHHTAVPFWDLLHSRSAILAAFESGHPWAHWNESWRYTILALLFLERGVDAAMAYMEANSKRYRGVDREYVRQTLESAERSRRNGEPDSEA